MGFKVEERQATSHLALNTKGVEEKSNSRQTQIGMKSLTWIIIGEHKSVGCGSAEFEILTTQFGFNKRPNSVIGAALTTIIERIGGYHRGQVRISD